MCHVSVSHFLNSKALILHVQKFFIFELELYNFQGQTKSIEDLSKE